MSGVYYYVEQKPGVPYQESRIRILCSECKHKLFPEEKMMFYTGMHGPFEIKCRACEKTLHEAKHD